MNAERDLLKAYQQKDDDMLMEWLMQESAIAKPSAQPKPKAADQKAPEPVKPGGFFSGLGEGAAAGGLGSFTSWLPSMEDLSTGAASLSEKVRKATGAGPKAEPAENADPALGESPAMADSGASGLLPTLGRAAAATLEEFSEGTKALATPGKGQPGLLETPVGNVPVPAAMMDAGPKLIGAMQAVFPFAAGAGSVTGDFAEKLESQTTDEQLAAAVKAAEEVAALTGTQADAMSARALREWYMLPREERLLRANEAANFAGQLMSGFVSGYTGVAKATAKGAAKMAGPAQAATAAARTARVNAVKAAGETLAAAEAERQTAAAVKAAQPVEQGGPRPPLTLADLRHGMTQEVTPGVKAGPSAPGSIPENMMTLDKLSARAKLNLLRTDPAAAQAMDETIPDARTLPRPGAGRVAATSDREGLRAEARTALEGEVPTTKPAPRAVDDAQLDEIVRSTNEGGASFSLDEKRIRTMDEGGFYVGGQAGTVSIKDRPVTPADIADFAKANEEALSRPGAHIGSEKLPDGTVNLDVSIRLEDEAEALKLGSELGEQRIWDATNGRAIDVPQVKAPELPDPTITGYHGTATTFDEYKPSGATRDGGTWFSIDPETAGARAMADLGEVVGDAPQIRPVALRLENIATEEQFREARMLMQGDTQLASELMQSKGYDAVVFNRPEIGPTANYLVFDPAKVARPLYGTIGQPLETALQAAERRMAERFQGLRDALSSERGSVDLRGSFAEGWEKNKLLWNDVVTIGAARLWEMQSVMVNKFEQWSEMMKAAYGSFVEPHLPAIFEQSTKRFNEILSKVERQMGRELPGLSQVLELYHKGESGLNWYDQAWPEIQKMFGKHAELYVQVLAALSPHNGVKGNITSANKAMALILSGKRSAKKPFKVTTETKAGDGMEAHVKNLNRVLKGQEISGPKVGPFSRALMGDRDAVVVDTWMMRAFGFSDKAADSEITFIQQAVTGIAEATGRDARQVQAAIWTGVKIMREGPQTFVEDIHKTIAGMLKDKKSQLYEMFGKELEAASKASRGRLSDEGFANVGALIVISRAAAFGTAGAMSGDDPHTSVRNALLAAGLGALASPKLARTIVKNMGDPEVRQILRDAVRLEGEQGALFPKPKPRPEPQAPRPSRDPLVVNQSNTGGSNEARALIRGVASRLEKARELERSKVVSHDETITAALHGRFRTVEDVLSLDEARLSLDELASVKVQVKGVRDFIAEEVIQIAARAKLMGSDELFDEAVDKSFLLAKVSQKWADLETAGGRFVEASKIKSPTGIASKYDLEDFASELAEMKKAMVGRGDVSSRQFVEMITTFADRAAAKKLAETASRWPEALWSIYYGLNLMGSPITHFRNMLGNLGGLGMSVVDRGFGEIIALPFHAVGRGDSMVQPGETWELAKGIVESVADSFRGGKDVKGAFGIARDAFRSGESVFAGGDVGKAAEALRVIDSATDQGVGTLPKVIEVMANLGRANLRFMGGTDEFFKVLSFNGEIRALAQRRVRASGLTGAEAQAEMARLIDSPDTAMLQQADAFAKENTFTKQFADGTWGKKVQDAVSHPLARLTVTPFYRTPMRLAEFSTTHTPIINVLAKQTWSDFAEGGVKANLAAAKMFTGTAAMATVAWFAIHGYVTGNAPSDPGLRAAYERVGWKEKSVYNPINGKYYSYDNLEPLSTIVSTAANMVQITRDLDEWDTATLFEAGTIALSKSILSKQWFQGLSDFFDVIEAANRGEDVGQGQEFIHRRLSTLIPGAAIWRTVNKATDDERREVKTVVDNENPELREFTKLVAIYTQNIPGWGWLIPGTKARPAMPHLITGEPMPAENSWLGAISPFQVSTLKNDPVLKELVALEGAGLPTELPRVLGGSQPMTRFHNPGDEQRQMKEGVLLNQEERQRLGVLLTKEIEDNEGRTLHQALTELIDSDEYQDMPDGRNGGKAGMIADTFNEFLDQAKEKLLEEFPKINQIIARRQLERGLLRVPKSMDDMKDFARESLDAELESR